METESLFRPFSLKSLHIKNRIVMAPMTRYFAPDGVLSSDVAPYYTRRTVGEVGLIISEGTTIERLSASNDKNVPHFYGDEALSQWKTVIDSVHTAGGSMGPQLWHMGIYNNHPSGYLPPAPFEGPSGLLGDGGTNGISMTVKDIEDTIAAYGRSAANAKRLGFDCVEFHGAHGYLIDQFFYEKTNKRTDSYGGKTIAERTRFGVELIKEVRRQVGEDFTIILRVSQWKESDFGFQNAKTPAELESWLQPLADAGVDIFHCSQRRFWEPEFKGADLNIAGWAKKVTGKATITVGSVGLNGEFIAGFEGERSEPSSLNELLRRFDRGDFDLVAVGRPILVDAEWPKKIREGRLSELKGFSKDELQTLS